MYYLYLVPSLRARLSKVSPVTPQILAVGHKGPRVNICAVHNVFLIYIDYYMAVRCSPGHLLYTKIKKP